MVTCILNLNSDEISQYSKLPEGWKDVTEAVKPVHTKLPPSQQGWRKGTEVLLLHSESRNIFWPPEISQANLPESCKCSAWESLSYIKRQKFIVCIAKTDKKIFTIDRLASLPVTPLLHSRSFNFSCIITEGNGAVHNSTTDFSKHHCIETNAQANLFSQSWRANINTGCQKLRPWESLCFSPV